MASTNNFSKLSPSDASNTDSEHWHLERLYDDQAPTLYGLILRIVKDDFIAEDVLTECFSKIKESRQLLNGKRENVMKGLAMLARQLALEKVKCREYRYQLMANELFKCRLYVNNDKPMNLYAEIRNAEAPLPDDPKTVLDMLYLEGLTIDQIAAKLNMTQDQVKQQIATAVNMLKTQAHSQPASAG